jgi:hypothetical protein
MRQLIALETFAYPYGGGPVVKGQRFEPVSERDAEALVLARRACEDDGTAERGAITEAEAAVRKARKYKTRDMQAGA